ncbi:signal peptide peptidase SppA [Shewanella corallii]|uniref:Signal peptide peptidase SppA n=1 Tax=Shewanella corallii TaxID=560080 RepID=A0ABT0N954_9GAMM|nr:signal peptide peptidase SppA [Shewanella corallii]MCL2914954.1 signal peptide peptidase SppA [Shewanella corallii]
MSTKPSVIRRIFVGLWRMVNGLRKLILNILVFGLLAAFIVTLSSDDSIKVKPDTALVLELSGSIVDQKRYIDPVEAFFSQGKNNPDEHEILLSDVLDTIHNATEDRRIEAIVLILPDLRRAGMSKLQVIGDALNEFRAAGKKVLAYGDYYDQQQYFLASFADRVYLNPQGGVMIDGLASYRMYFKSALEKLDVQTHVFRVGTYKSAVEPFLRDDMSPAAKEANTALLGGLWQSYEDTILANRKIKADTLSLNADEYLAYLDKAKGQPAMVALQLGWVDALGTLDSFRSEMKTLVAADDEHHTFRQVHFEDYLSLINQPSLTMAEENIALVVAKGKILNGYQQPGEIGGESTSALLRKARYDDDIKAVVLRVDSPGGSAFASEQIRQEVLALQQANKPVVVSMGSYAASGGYWISADADYIFATPTTITGSIGIFGMITTFEKTLANLGIHTDGVATSDWAGLTVTRSLSPQVQAVIQRGIERGYSEFINIVAQGRNMSTTDVDKIAQGRVWTGVKALELGLVDELGDLQAAVAKAAEFAGLEHYDTKLIEQELSAEQALIQDLFGAASAYLPQMQADKGMLAQMLSKAEQELQILDSFNDPNGIYLYCDICNY